MSETKGRNRIATLELKYLISCFFEMKCPANFRCSSIELNCVLNRSDALRLTKVVQLQMQK